MDSLLAGESLRRAREAKGMSRAELARRTGLQRTTITNLEAGRTTPAPDTLRRLAKVLGEGEPPPPLAQPEFFAPTYQPLRLAEQMTAQLNAAGGALDQVYLYLDYQSALDWVSASTDPEYERRYRNRMPLDVAAQQIADLGIEHGADVIALGSGDGKCETRLTKRLAELLPAQPELRLYLLDISHALIHTAYQHATNELPGIAVIPLHGDLYQLPQYPSFAHRAPHDLRTRIWTFIGNTFSNLTDELAFMTDLASCARPGDFAVIDVDIAWAPAADLAAVRAADPVCNRPLGTIADRWLTGPIRRHCRGVREVNVTSEPTNRCPVPGSYQHNFVAAVRLQDGSERRYTVMRSKRYDPELLAQTIDDLGWEQIQILRFGPGVDRHALLVFRRK